MSFFNFRPVIAGIHPGPKGAYSIALSGGYEDDLDYGECFTYTGEGQAKCSLFSLYYIVLYLDIYKVSISVMIIRPWEENIFRGSCKRSAA